ncbi:MAG: MBL fold metallo-hydrolase [Saccharofermentanales bacterium]|jgi:hydroxyacylglutathione hydrolase|nr:MBL fold metallo-hydrolase [Clostridiaceae bacterium]
MHEIITLPYGPLEACVYLIHLPSSTCLIDPAIRPENLPDGLPAIRWLIATHGHFDHISQADTLRRKTGAPLYIHTADHDYLLDPRLNLSMVIVGKIVYQPAEHKLTDGQILELTDGYRLEVIHTPGHSPGGICLLLHQGDKPIALFSGDTLFAGSIGRLDLDGDPAAMAESLIRLGKLSQRPGVADIPVFPGHGPATTLKDELLHNPYFKMSRTDLAESGF